MDQIVHDESRTLLSGVFYEFGVHISDDMTTLAEKRDDTWIVSSRNPTADELSSRKEENWMWVDLVLREKDLVVERPCRVHRAHVWKSRIRSAHADILGGQRLSAFIPSSTGGKVVVTATFAERLKESGLTGMQFIPLQIEVNQTVKRPDPILYVLEFAGSNCLRPLRVQGVPNACPYCGDQPLVCPDCGYRQVECLNCGRLTAILSQSHEGAGDQRLKLQAVPKAGRILDGTKWDQSDFVNCGWYFISRRAVDWLLSVHAAPFYVRPARVNVEGLNMVQMARIEAAKQPLPLKAE